jgi:hypothetical protein
MVLHPSRLNFFKFHYVMLAFHYPANEQKKNYSKMMPEAKDRDFGQVRKHA